MILSSRKLLEKQVRFQVKNELVYRAFKKVDRKLFVPKRWEDFAYQDSAISLGADSSISQPSLVAQMIDLLELTGREHVLEIGTASGYSAAILSLCCKKVDTIEIDSGLAETARKKLKLLGFNNITVHTGDGSLGLPEEAPFDAVIVTAAAREVPKALVDQLKVHGRMVIPIQAKNSDMQELMLYVKENSGLIKSPISVVQFVPLVEGGE